MIKNIFIGLLLLTVVQTSLGYTKEEMNYNTYCYNSGQCEVKEELKKIIEEQVSSIKKGQYRDCTVTRIVDGDTFICDKEKIRIAGINAPELKKKGKKAEAYSNISKTYLSKLIKGKQVSLQIIGKDKYKRTLAYVDLFKEDKSTDISQEMLMKGMAKSYTDFPNIEDSDKEILLSLEKEAKKNKVGLWSK